MTSIAKKGYSSMTFHRGLGPPVPPLDPRMKFVDVYTIFINLAIRLVDSIYAVAGTQFSSENINFFPVYKK